MLSSSELANKNIRDRDWSKAKFMEFGHFRVLDIGAEKKPTKKARKRKLSAVVPFV